MHDAAPVRTFMRSSIAFLFLVALGGCGSTAKPGSDGGGGSSPAGAGGTTGAGGTVGSGGRGGGNGGAGGTVGAGGAGGCAPNQGWCAGCEPGTGACYVGGCPGVACPPPDGGAGRGGTAGRGGSSGGATGAGGKAGAGGTGGNACAQLQAFDRSCATDGDCSAIEYTSNCCGGRLWTGVPKSTQSAAASLGSQCTSSLPLCGCADPSVRTDDGSIVETTFGAPATIS